MNKMADRLGGPILSAYGLGKDYAMPGGNIDVLKKVNLAVYPGDWHFIVGKSGSGKSTLLHLLGLLDQPTQGKILFEGEDVTRIPDKLAAKIRNKRIGFVFQMYHLLPELTLFENVLLPSRIAGKKQEDWTKELLKRVKLLSRQNHYPSELSGGEQQRAAIARALINKPALVLCDEPTGNLDVESAEIVMTLLRDLHREEGAAMLVVTHDAELARADESILHLVEGELTPLNNAGKS